MLLIELVHFTSLLFLHPLRDEMRLGTINFLCIFNACMHPRREMVVVKSAIRLVGVSLILRSAITKLFNQFLTVVQICNFLVLVYHVTMSHLSSLDFGDILLPGLLDETGLVSGYLSPDASILHLSVIDCLLLDLLALPPG